MKPITNFLAAGLLLFATQVFGQLTTTFSPSSIPSTPIGNHISLMLKVSGFTNITSLQLPITYDKTVLRFDSIDNPILPGFTDTTLASFPIAGKIVISWYPQPAQYPNGFSVSPDGTSIFTLRFTVIASGTATVNVSTAAPGIEVINNQGNPVTVNYAGGGSTVVGGNGGPPPPAGCSASGNPPAATTYTGFKIIANKTYVSAGEHACLPITVNKFDSIVTLQYGLHWDSTKFQYDCVRGINLDYLSNGSFNNPTTGTQVMIWYDGSAQLNGFSRANGVSIYEVCFKAIGAPGSKSVVTIDGNGFQAGSGGTEATNAKGQSLWVAGTGVKDTLIITNPGNPGCPISYAVAKDTVDPGATVCVDVKASNFFWATSSEFLISYDTAKLKYQNIQLGANPLNLTTTGTTNFLQSAGNVKFTWANNTPANGTTLPDNTTLFSVCFKSQGAASSQGAVNITSSIAHCPVTAPDVALEAARRNVGGVPITLTQGWVSVKSGPTCSVTPTATTPACAGGFGNLNVTTGGNGCTATAYAWAGPNGYTSNVQNPTNAPAAGTYTVTVTFGANGTVTATTSMTVTAPSVSASAVNPACPGGSGSLMATLGGSTCTPTTWAWSGPGGYTASVQNPTNPTASGVYTVTATFQNGATATSTASISGSSPTVTASAVNPNCNGGNGTLHAAPGGTGCTANSYSWTGPGGFTSNVQDPANATAPGTYTVTATFSGGGTATATTSLTVPPVLDITAQNITVQGINCYGDANGSISITTTGGTSPYTYSWQGPSAYTSTAQNIINLKAGNYIVTVTDSKQCTHASAVINVAGPSAPLGVNTGSITMSNVNCNQGSDGAISLAQAVTGGTSPYSATWSSGASGLSINNLVPGTYSVTVTDAKGCTFVPQAMNIYQPTPINFSGGVISNVKCLNDTNGSITITVSGGTMPYSSFVWKNPTGTVVSNIQNPTGLAAGNYTVTVTDAHNCTKTYSPPSVQGPPSQLTVQMTSSTPALCPGQASGSVCLGINGGWPGASTIAWSSNNNFSVPPVPCPNGIPGGTYTATVTDAGGCTSTTVVVVNSPAPITTAPAAVHDVTCHGNADGTISILPINGGNGGPYTVKWSNTSLSGGFIAALPGGSYTPTVTDANGCTAVFAADSVKEPLVLAATAVITPQNGIAQNGQITQTATDGTPPYFYLWNTGETTKDLVNLLTGNYTCTVTDSHGCSVSNTYTVTQSNTNHLSPGSKIIKVIKACDNDGSIVIQISDQATNDGPFIIKWTGAPPITVPNTTVTIMGLGASNNPYYITITDHNGNSIVLDTIVGQAAPATSTGSQITPPLANQHNGKIQVFTADPNVSFIWSNNKTGNPLVGIDSGTYCVTITNNLSGCTKSYCYHVQRTYLDITTTISGSNLNCLSAQNGSIHVTASNGNPPFSFQWAGPNGYSTTTPQGLTSDISNLLPGIYTVTITDQNDSIQVLTDTLTAQSMLAITNVSVLSSYHGYQVRGAGTCDGIASVNFAGQLGATAISWSNGVTLAQNSTLCAGPYSVTVSDSNGCTSVWSGDLSAPTAIATDFVVDVTPTCHGSKNGVAHVTVGGGVPPYTVHWSTNQTDNLTTSGDISQSANLKGGTYSVTVTDYNAVTKVLTGLVTDPDPITLNYTSNQPSAFNTCDGSVILDVQGANLPFSITWTGDKGTSHTGHTAEALNLCSGEVVQFVVVDTMGCIATGHDSVPYPKGGCLQVRPVLTPGQQDGKNDFLLITCIETVQNAVEIYNRWGQLVFQTTNYDNSSNNWKGLTQSGEPLAAGVYFYILTYTDDQGNQQQQKGYINLLL